MFTTKISPFDLEGRVDAEYYSPKAIKCLKKVKSFAEYDSLGGIIIKGYRVVYHGTDETNGLDDNQILPFLSPSQIDKEGKIDFEKLDSLPLYYKEKYPKGLAFQDELLIEVKGNVSKLAIVPNNIPKNLMISGSLYKASISKDYDSRFILSFLKCKHGQVLKSRLTSNTIISYIAKDDLYSIPVFKIDKRGQNYIGNKVRQAELLRDRSYLIESKADELFIKSTNELGYLPKKSEKSGWATLENRLDPVFYDKQYSFFNDEWFVESSKPLTNYIAEGSYGVLPASNSYGTGNCRFITAADIVEANYNSQLYVNVPIEEVHKKARIAKGQILLEIKGGINYCVVASDILTGTYVNGSVFRFSVSGIDENYLAFYLNSKFKNLYCDRVSVNNIIKYLDQESIHSLPVLRLHDDIESFLGNSYEKIQLLKTEIFNLTQASKFLVEALIEGQITESQLIEAQQALEEGDNSKDRAILSKITDKGYLAGDSKPLFSDLDKLYELLDEAKLAVDADEESV